jgi:glycosyltransferase involved in cell wall biosynthesis
MINGKQRRPVRVCFMIDTLKPAGTETQLLALIRHLDRSRVRPTLCLLNGEEDLSRSLEPRDCPIVRLGVKGLCRPKTAIKAGRLLRFLRRHRIDILQVYFPDSTYLGVPVARLARVPRIVCTRNNIGYWTTPMHRQLGRLSHRLASGLLANCQACGQSVTDSEGLSPKRIAVLENGVDLSRFPRPLRWPHSGPGKSRRVGIAANLRPVKDLESFVRAAGKLVGIFPEADFHIAGEGELRPALEELMRDLNLTGRVFLPGSIQDMPRFLRDLDIAVLCSRSEGMSNAILEYMAAGKAIVATAVGGNVQLLEHERHGLLVPPGDPGRLADSIGRLLNDPALAVRLAQAARQRIEERFSREVMVRRFEVFYEKLFWEDRFPRSLNALKRELPGAHPPK